MTIKHRVSARKGDTYRVSIYDPLTQRMKWVGTFYDEIAAKQAELDAEKRVRAGLSPVGIENPKVTEMVDKWLTYAHRESTRQDYERSARFFKEFFGQRRMRTLKPEDFHRFVLFMGEQRKRNGKPYAPRVVRKVVVQLYQVMNLAVELGYLDRSPAPKMKRLPLPDEPAPRKVRLSAQQVKDLLEAAPDGWRDFFIVALASGARRGELFNATYGAVRWDERAIDVRDQQPDGTMSGVKSRAAVRTIPLPASVIERLRERKAETGAGDEDLIFPNSLGRRISAPNFYTRIWRPATKKAGLMGLHLHDLRKAYATQLAIGGHTPSYIEDVMGHASYATTMKYYTMTPEEEAERARKALGDWLGREGSGQLEAVAPSRS